MGFVMPYCKKCGSDISNDSHYCNVCGDKIDSTKVKKQGNRLLIFHIVFLSVVGFIWLGALALSFVGGLVFFAAINSTVALGLSLIAFGFLTFKYLHITDEATKNKYFLLFMLYIVLIVCLIALTIVSWIWGW
jgi:predicted nucleic acid-binding Zn ribbon protein